MIAAVLTASRFGLAAVSGLDDFVDASAQFAVKLALGSRRVDETAALEMVDAMRSRVPRDTGRLLNGITFEIDADGTATVTASAVNPRGRGGGDGADYAMFVERGTAHADAQPYFDASAEEVLAKRGQSLDAAVALAAEQGGFR